jgi:hypothetical protein
MAYETIVAVFDTRAHADTAVKALKAGRNCWTAWSVPLHLADLPVGSA